MSNNIHGYKSVEDNVSDFFNSHFPKLVTPVVDLSKQFHNIYENYQLCKLVNAMMHGTECNCNKCKKVFW